jgi:hypothetical protein
VTRGLRGMPVRPNGSPPMDLGGGSRSPARRCQLVVRSRAGSAGPQSLSKRAFWLSPANGWPSGLACSATRNRPVFPRGTRAGPPRAPRYCPPAEPCPSRLRCSWPKVPNPATARPTGRSPNTCSYHRTVSAHVRHSFESSRVKSRVSWPAWPPAADWTSHERAMRGRRGSCHPGQERCRFLEVVPCGQDRCEVVASRWPVRCRCCVVPASTEPVPAC